MSAFDDSILIFPISYLEGITDNSNEILESTGLSRTFSSEILRFFGDLILMTVVEQIGCRV